MTLTVLAVLTGLVVQEPASTSSPPAAHRVQGAIEEPKKLKHVPPRYPDDALRAGLRGLVVLECVIDRKGKVIDARVVSGVPPLTDAADQAAKKWRYTPTLLNGTAVPVIMTVTVRFTRLGPLRLDELLESLRSKNEFIRESAAQRLGTARSSGFGPSDLAGPVRELRRLADHDPSEPVRTAAAGALKELEWK
jgi:TonB family protein